MPNPRPPLSLTIAIDDEIARYLNQIYHSNRARNLPFYERRIVRVAVRRGLRQMTRELSLEKNTNEAVGFTKENVVS